MRGTPRAAFSFTGKAVVAALLAALADWLFYDQWIGSTLGGFALAWALALLVAMPAVRRRTGARRALAVAVVFALILADHPDLLDLILFWAAVSSAAILGRARFDDALRWAERLLMHSGFGAVRILDDLRRLLRIRGPRRGPGIGSLASLVALPLIGGAVFLALFASANPLIAEAFNAVTVPSPGSFLPHVLVFALAAAAVWPSLRPHPRVSGLPISAASLGGLPGVPPATVALSLVTFNAVFALQNLLDIAFLWSGARLPGTITLADYAHRGAYALIATALLAGLFVLIVLRPGGASARSRPIRWLVSLWVAQTLLLVASSIHRTLDYVGAYSLTVLRIAALGWMVLVGIGLVLICWRLLRGRSGAWLINANALAAAVALTLWCAIDPAAVAAGWNVRHARELGGAGAAIDLCYLRQQGASALLPLIELEARTTDADLQDRARSIREEVLHGVTTAQSDWHAWTFRNARRLSAAQAALGPNPAGSAAVRWGRDCDGGPNAEPVTTTYSAGY